MTGRGLAAFCGLTALAAGACSDSMVDPGPGLDYTGSVLSPATANVNSVRIDVTAAGYDSVGFVLRTAGEPDQVSASYGFTDSTAVGSALGMLADHTYQIVVVLHAGSDADTVETLDYTTGALPDWIPAMTTAGTPAADGYLALSHPEGPIIVDNQGRVRWYLSAADPTLINFQSHPTGEYTLYGTQDVPQEFRVLDERGDVVRMLACVGGNTRFHEVRVLADGSYWITCNDPVQMDLTSIGGKPDVNVVWTTIQHVAEDGSLLKEIRARDLFGLDDLDPDGIADADNVNATHGNAIEFDVDGNLLVSFRSLNEITKIDATTGAIIWRMGGRGNVFTIVDPTREYVRQHGLRLVSPGVIQFLDNGSLPPSRFVRYAIDEQSLTANLLFDYIDPTNAFTQVGGSTEVVGDGGALISFGRAGRVVELDASGNVSFELLGIEDQYIFRAVRIPSLYAARRREPSA